MSQEAQNAKRACANGNVLPLMLRIPTMVRQPVSSLLVAPAGMVIAVATITVISIVSTPIMITVAPIVLSVRGKRRQRA